MKLRRRKSGPARVVDKVKRSGLSKTAQGAGKAVGAAGRTGKAMAEYTGRKATGKRGRLMIGVPAVAGASVATFFAVRKMRRGVKQTVPG